MNAEDSSTRFVLSDGTAVSPSNPFFITGPGRCGTTLMRRLVIEHTGAVIPPENHSLASSARVLQAAAGEWPLFCRLEFDHLRLYSGGAAYFGMDEAIVSCLLASIPENCRTATNFWHGFHAVYAVLVGKASDTRWGDKTPSNTAELPDLLQLFPQARFVFMLRDVFDTAWSYGNMDVAGRAGRFFEGAQRWVLAVSKMFEFARAHRPQVLFVRYEDLVQCPARVMAEVVPHLGLSGAGQACLREAEARDIVERPHLGNVLGAVRADFIGRGRTKLPGDILRQISGIAAAWQSRCGYEPGGQAESPPSR